MHAEIERCRDRQTDRQTGPSLKGYRAEHADVADALHGNRGDGPVTVAVSEPSSRIKTEDAVPASPFNLHWRAIERESSLSKREIGALQKWRGDVTSDHIVGRHSRSISSANRRRRRR